MYQGFYVVSDGVQAANWHVDYWEGSSAYTLLTPLYELDPEHGHLWYGSDRGARPYKYRRGVAVLVGEGFPLNRTLPDDGRGSS